MSVEWEGCPPYVPVADRRAIARRTVARLRKQGRRIDPVEIGGRSIARSFWGRAWCEHLEKFADFAYRLERGRSYVRNDAVCHLAVGRGAVQALVMGSELYEVEIKISALPAGRWKELRRDCAGSIDSLVELLAGRLSDRVMQAVTDRDRGLFPQPKEIRLRCSCPDIARLCKHVAAVLYGIGARLDTAPELLFVLRGVDHAELIAGGADAVTSLASSGAAGSARIADDDLADVFGIEMATDAPTPPAARTDTGSTAKTPMRQTTRRGQPRPGIRGQRDATTAATRKADKPRLAARGDRQNRTAPARPATRPRPAATATAPEALTAAEVADLRERLGLTRAELADLLGVSSAAVGLWERAVGTLNLQRRTRESLQDAMHLTPRAARRRLGSV